MKFIYLMLTLCLLLGVVGCSKIATSTPLIPTPPNASTVLPTTGKAPEQVRTLSVDNAYPIQSPNIVNDVIPGYPVNNKVLLETPTIIPTIIVPTAELTTGVVTGKIVTKNGGEKPYIAPGLYLGKAIYANQLETNPIISLDEQNDPKAIQDSNGDFVFQKVPAGKYGVIIWSPISTTIIEEPKNKGAFLIVIVQPGNSINLGTLVLP
jgi:hypothetical protein